jgi:hypothetical protein
MMDRGFTVCAKINNCTRNKASTLCIRDVRWLCVSASGSFSWSHSRSEICEHRVDSQQLWSYRYVKFKMIWMTRNTIIDVLPGDGAPPHFRQHMAGYLSEQFPGQCIGHCGLQNWPLLLPDLITPRLLHNPQAWGSSIALLASFQGSCSGFSATVVVSGHTKSHLFITQPGRSLLLPTSCDMDA